MYPCVVRIFRTPKAARLSNGPEQGVLLLCEFQAQDINTCLDLERQLVRASVGPCPTLLFLSKGPDHGAPWGTDPVKPGSIWVLAALGAHPK